MPDSEAFNAIQVVADYCISVQYDILATMIWTAEDIADSYINDIWKLYSLLGHITSDQSPELATKFL